MTEGNGSGNSRMDRIERMQEEFQRDLNLLLRAQVVQQGQMDEDRREWRERTRQLDEEAKERARQLDARIAELVSSMGKFIAQILEKRR